MNLLVATPTARLKDYAFERWHNAVRLLGVDYLMVDNSEDSGYVNELKERGVWAVRLDPLPHSFVGRFNKSWEYIWDIAEKEGYDYILSIESDIVVPSNTIDVMMAAYLGCDFVRHAYPWREPRPFMCYGMGCTLAGIDQWWYAINTGPEHMSLEVKIKNFRCKDIDILTLQHLNE